MFWNGSTAIEGLSGRGSEEPNIGISVGRGLTTDLVCPDGLGDVFHSLLTEIDEPDRQLRPDMISHGPRDANPACLSKTFQASSDVDPIAEKIVALHHDVADMDSA